MKYFMYCRKSSEAEDRQVASIESQLSTLKRSFEHNSSVQIIGIYEEAFSAKAPGRPRFSEMISRIEAGGAEGIIAWAPDRLARNSIDGGQIIYMLDRGKIKDLKFATYTFENNSQGKFMLQIMFSQSKYYSDALSDNVKRGNRTKIEKGWWPNKPPPGWLNDPATRTIVRDPERFPRMRDMFDLVLNDGQSPRAVWEIATKEWDLRTLRRKGVGGRPITLSAVYKILSNPFYAGILMWNGRTYPGAHEPVVSLEEFERVQGLLRRREKPRPYRRSFAFTGLIRCGECGFLVTAEEKVKKSGLRYTYYHCTKRRMDYRCRQPYVSEARLERDIEQFVESLGVPPRIHDWVTQSVSSSHRDDQVVIEQRTHAIQDRLGRAKKSLENLTSLRVRDLIGDDEFVRERQKLEMDQLRFQEELENAGRAVLPFEPIDTLISFRNRAIEWFRVGDTQTKRLILKTVGSNPVLKDKMLRIEAKKPFLLASEMDSLPKLRAAREDIRTLWIHRDPELREIVDNIRRLELTFGIRSRDERRAAA